MTWDALVRELNATPDRRGWLHVTRRRAQLERRYVIQRVPIGDWELALIQTTIAPEARLGAAEAVARLVPFPLGALVFSEGFWVLRQALPLDGLTLDRVELVLRCLDVQAQELVPRREAETTRAAGTHFKHYAD